MPRKTFKRVSVPSGYPSPKKPAIDEEEEIRSPDSDVYTTRLPSEIWKMIIDPLDARSRRQLRRVNRRLNYLVDFDHKLKSIADVYITEKNVVISFLKEGLRTERFTSGFEAFSQREMRKLSHSLRKMVVKTLWIDIRPSRVSAPKYQNLVKFMGRVFAACLSGDATITMTHPTILILPTPTLYSFLLKRISGKRRRLIFPFIQYTDSYRRLIHLAASYNWSYFEVRFWVMGDRYSNMRWFLPEFHIKPGKIDHMRIIQPMSVLGRRIVSEYISYLRRADFKIGIVELFSDIPYNTIDVLQPRPIIMRAVTPLIASFERAERLNNPVRPVYWKGCTIHFTPHLVTRVSPLLPRIPSIGVTGDRCNYNIPYIIKSANRIVVYFDNE